MPAFHNPRTGAFRRVKVGSVAFRILSKSPDWRPHSPGAPLKAPDPSERKAVWVDYATAQGVDRGDAEDLTKRELIDRFGA